MICHSKPMEANQQLSKYARKQLRLAEEKNFGTDYTKQIEEAEREPPKNHEVNACADRANKLDAIEEYKLKINRVLTTIKNCKIKAKAFRILINATPIENEKERLSYAKNVATLEDKIRENEAKVEEYKLKIKRIAQELKIDTEEHD